MKRFISLLLTPLSIFAAHDQLIPQNQDVVNNTEILENHYIFDIFPPLYFPASSHVIVEVSILGDSVKLEDGSIWNVGRYDSYRLQNWRVNDTVTITQNHSWFSSYKYRIVREQTGSTIEANLFLGPIEQGPYTLYIITLDPVQGLIHLMSGKGELTRWEISSSDRNLFAEWRFGDAVIIGQNTGWDRTCESYLINVNENAGVRAKQY
ncbi:MAG TPA: hypothetical protein VJK48_02405 [Chlamydiales bacterium]|nr:hypothetical protein [Chlamydiales bacterium]